MTSFTEQPRSSTSFANANRNAATFTPASRSFVAFGALTFDQEGADTFNTIRGLNGEAVGDLTFDSLVNASPWGNQNKS